MIGWTRLRLTAWGRWARGGLPSLPTMSSTEKARMGRGGTGDRDMPAHIAEVDHAVALTPMPQKRVLIVFYCQQGRITEKASRLEMDRHRFRRLLAQGESFVESNL